jgi:hypothetical protein
MAAKRQRLLELNAQSHTDEIVQVAQSEASRECRVALIGQRRSTSRCAK